MTGRFRRLPESGYRRCQQAALTDPGGEPPGRKRLQVPALPGGPRRHDDRRHRVRHPRAGRRRTYRILRKGHQHGREQRMDRLRAQRTGAPTRGQCPQVAPAPQRSALSPRSGSAVSLPAPTTREASARRTSADSGSRTCVAEQAQHRTRRGRRRTTTPNRSRPDRSRAYPIRAGSTSTTSTRQPSAHTAVGNRRSGQHVPSSRTTTVRRPWSARRIQPPALGP